MNKPPTYLPGDTNWPGQTERILQRAAVKPYSMKQLYTLYQVSDKTFTRWLKPYRQLVGQRNGNLYTPKQVDIIFSLLGVPEVEG